MKDPYIQGQEDLIADLKTKINSFLIDTKDGTDLMLDIVNLLRSIKPIEK
jgi:hypothetical protein